MAVSPGARLGPYEIVSKLGEGGMGQVYRARDTKLGRDVAIKVLPDVVAADPDRVARFEREARTLAALNHPNIAHVYDAGRLREEQTATDIAFLAMELVDGDDLSVLINRALALPDAIAIAKQMADALEAAHEQGIIHRDLKPANVKVRDDGTVKVLDFGLAKALETTDPAAVSSVSNSPTLTARATQMGMILGTAAYMAPEQARGRAVDRRADIWAFGVVLYEMLTGTRAFEGDDVSITLASVLKEDVKWDALPVSTPPRLKRLLVRCIDRDVKTRLRDIGEARIELARLQAGTADLSDTATVSTAQAAIAPPSRAREFTWMAATILAIVTAGVIYWQYPKPAADPAPVTFTVAAAEGIRFAGGPGLVEVSPDGQQIAYVTSSDGGNIGSLWIRPLASLVATRVPNGEAAWHPVWSPNGKSIVFVASTASVFQGLKRLDLAGGPASLLADSATERPAWGSQGVILYTGPDGLLYKVSENGGASTAVTELDKNRLEVQHTWPEFLPDGRRFVFLARSTDRTKSALYLGSLDSPSRSLLVNATSMVEYVPGWLVYQNDGTITALRFDEATGKTLDEPIPVVENVQYNEVNGRAAFSLSPSGVLAYRMGSSLGRDLQFTWFDRTGKQLGTLGKPGPYRLQALSRDGRRLVASEAVANSNLDLTMIDVERDTATGFTSGLGDDSSPVWTPDGLSVIFRTSIKGAQDLAIKAAGGATASRVLLETGVNKTPTDVSRDGSTLLYETGGINARLWALPLKEGAKPFQVFPGSTDVQRNGKWSPDGKLIAYQSGSPRGSSVFVQPYPPTGAREQISGANGTDPHWSSDGRQIFFITSDGQIMSVDLTVTGGQVRVSKPRELFKRTAHGPNIFEMDPKGERFLMLVDPQGSNAPEPAPEPLTVVVNWLATLKRR